jgi:hypothetical protein
MSPDYTSGVGPIPSSWTDASSHSDACPSFLVRVDDGLRLRIYTDAANPAHRDCGPSVERFTIVLHREEEEPCGLFGTSEWRDVLDFVAGFRTGYWRNGNEPAPVGVTLTGYIYGCREWDETIARGIEFEAERSRA